jgi:glycosyltransferase involved in cell wall biosynthesis
MSAGLPIVATRCGRAVEDTVDADVGELVPNGDPEALASAIRGLLGDRERRERLGKAARTRARPYEPEIVARRYDELFAEVVAGRRSSEP